MKEEFNLEGLGDSHIKITGRDVAIISIEEITGVDSFLVTQETGPLLLGKPSDMKSEGPSVKGDHSWFSLL
ncbi:hypothetical protein PGT21_007013 [Puccinia graminis f. sp. tritici]|uniref:Uncharacterized protein n=1 Tax=Puccinia graminis f. sp. tritici TaxID=56615 RepID=A0A5B0MWT4_PUCGR|nr:hypothetical protein PGTUg99_027691 [Puccinia graminis f. sp. tritici]KAA1103999.1 hypothetical protein PGT21_007013 [Puccinia graminis f. sp. tritici]